MRFFAKILLIIFTVGLSGVCLAGPIVLENKEIVMAGFYLQKQTTLDVELRKRSDDGQVPIHHMTFTGIKEDDFGIDDPWVIADQYLVIKYECNLPSWGIRMVTGNKFNWNKMYPKPIAEGEDGQWEWEKTGDDGYFYVDGQYQTGDDLVSYGGLIHKDKIEDPRLRAELAWQIYQDKQFPDILTDDLVDPTPGDPADDWKTDWAYLVDKGSSGYVDELMLGYFFGEDGEVLAKYNYNLAIFGNGGADYLAQHPVISEVDGNPEPKPGDDEVVVFVGGRFCSTDYSDPDNPVDFMLPAGKYGTTIYVELLHE